MVFFGKWMGYVGVIIFGGKGMVDEKMVVLEVVNIVVVCSFVDMGEVVVCVMKV